MKADKLFVGIDPGVNGGVAATDPKGHITLLGACPTSHREMYRILKEVCHEEVTVIVVIEKVVLGFAGSSKASMAKLYGNYQVWLALAAVCEYQTYVVTSTIWQNAIGCEPSGNTRADRQQHKRKLRDKAKQLYPEDREGITLSNCDALLISHFCRQMYR